MSASKVFFQAVDCEEKPKALARKVRLLFEAADLGACVGRNDFTAVKLHFGDRKNDTHIPPQLVKPVVEAVKKRHGRVFLTETCVLYKSPRNNAVEHIQLALEHGFTPQNVRAPIVIADGLLGNMAREVAIPGKIFEKVSIARMALDAGAMMVLSHVTGHIGTGLGGAIKNLGMGLASRKGKLRQHSVMKPAIAAKKCTGCWVCLDHCPEDAISQNGEIAAIDGRRCIGCGECLTVCLFDAVEFDWKRKDYDLQQRMAEHALGAVIGKPGKVGYMNFLLSVTKDCDCFSTQQTPIIPDIGILAGTDPVAIDAASLDLIREEQGKTLADMSYPGVDPYVQLRHAEAIGLGSMEYELIGI